MNTGFCMKHREAYLSNCVLITCVEDGNQSPSSSRLSVGKSEQSSLNIPFFLKGFTRRYIDTDDKLILCFILQYAQNLLVTNMMLYFRVQMLSVRGTAL